MNKVLVLDIAGNPYKWVSPADGDKCAAAYYASGKVAYDWGDHEMVIHGGRNRASGLVSTLIVKSIIGIRNSERFARLADQARPLGKHNDALFQRDDHRCAYCTLQFPSSQLTRDHIHPRSKGGQDTWMNCVTACYACNQKKADKLLSDDRHELCYLPYVPCRFEHFILSSRNILADQMEYLRSRLPKHSRLSIH